MPLFSIFKSTPTHFKVIMHFKKLCEWDFIFLLTERDIDNVYVRNVGICQHEYRTNSCSVYFKKLHVVSGVLSL